MVSVSKVKSLVFMFCVMVGFCHAASAAPADVAKISDAQKICDEADAVSREGHYKEALALYGRALAADNKLKRGYLNRGIAYDQMNKYQEALSDFNKALSLCKTDDVDRKECFYNRGMCLLRLGRYADAIKDFDNALSITPGDSSFRFMRGRAFRLSGKNKEALADFNAVLNVVPESDERAYSFLQRGLVYAAMGQLGKAIDDYSSAIPIYEKNFDGSERQLKGSKHGLPAAYFERGNAYKKIGKHSLASADLKKAQDFHYRPDTEHRLPVKAN